MRRNRLIYYFTWILSLVGISFYGGVVSYGIFCALTLLPVIMYAYLLFVLRGFTIYQQLGSKNVVSRTPVSYYFTLQNETKLAFARLKVTLFEFGVDYGNLRRDEEYELMPEKGHTVTTNIVCRYRGEYEIGVKQVIITDFFNMFRITYKNPSPLKVNVFPAIEYPSEEMELEQPLFASSMAHNAPEMRDVLVRPYTEGDPLRSINWKATAKNLRLMTAKMISEERSSVHILLDTKRIGEEPAQYLPREDELLTRLITLVIYFANKNIGVEVSYYSHGMQHVMLKSMLKFEEFYSSISSVVFVPDIDIGAIRTDMLKRGVVSETNLFVLTQQEQGTEVKE